MKGVAGWVLLGLISCGKNKDVDEVYQSCEAPEDCEVPESVDAVCVDKSGAGFCTWECEVDVDCDEAEEADFDFDYGCASFESEDALYCFPMCNSDADDPEDECPPAMTCRSTGGGSDNRKICFPEG